MKKPYFPLFIDISQTKIVVIGGGKVAERRVRTLLEFAQYIQVISPELTEGLHHFKKNGQIEWRKEHYRAEALEGAGLVLAATGDDACNEAVVRDCKSRGIPVNTAHKKEMCDFYFPAVVVKEHVAVGITASGCSHARARAARESIEEALKKI